MGHVVNAKIQIIDKAVLIYEDIKTACSRPDKSVTGETLGIYNELADWAFTDKFPISDDKNRWLYVTLISIFLTNGSAHAEHSDSAYIKEKSSGKWQMINAALERATKPASKKKE